MSGTYHVVLVEQSEAATSVLGGAHGVRAARQLAEEHLESKRSAKDYLTGDDVSAVTRGTPADADAGWEQDADGNQVKSFTSGYRVKIVKVKSAD